MMAVHRIHACSAPRRASVSRRFSLCRAFSFPFRSLRETDREFGREKGSEVEEKLPGNTCGVEHLPLRTKVVEGC